MRHALLAIVLLNAGCESCDFSFGLIPVDVTVDAGDRQATVSICAEEQPCTSGSTRLDDTGTIDTTAYHTTVYGNTDPNTVTLAVGWHGYTTCKVPALEILVEAEGCEPTAITTERAVENKAQTSFFARLDCD